MKSFIFILALLVSLSVQSASVELEWSCKNDENVAEYSLSFGSDSGLTVTSKIFGKNKSVKIDTLTEGKSYWFQITPILKSGVNGKPSNIIWYKVPSKPVDDKHSTPELRIKKSKMAP
jgi:hypothetical protein